MSDAVVTLVAVLAGGIAAITGFGIGSLLTPVFALRLDTKLAVAAVSIPHLVGTAVRFARLKQHVSRPVFVRFGVPSAIGGLAGAFLHNTLGSPALEAVFGGLLFFAGMSKLTGVSRRLRFEVKAVVCRRRVGHVRRIGRQPGRDPERRAAASRTHA